MSSFAITQRKEMACCELHNITRHLISFPVLACRWLTLLVLL